VRISQVVENCKLLWPQTFLVHSGDYYQPPAIHNIVSHPWTVMLLESLQQNEGILGTKTQTTEGAVSADIEGRW